MPWSVAFANLFVKLPPVIAVYGATTLALHGAHWGYFVTMLAVALWTNQTMVWSSKPSAKAKGGE